MIGGSNNVVGGNYSPLTGLGALKVVGVNPTNDEYEKIVGSPLPYELKYDKVENTNSDGTIVKMQPIQFLVYNEDFGIYNLVKFYIGNTPIVTKAGDKYKFMDSLGRISYYVDSPENISEKFTFDKDNCRKLNTGEDKLHTFLQTLVKYRNSDPSANWAQDLANSNVTPEKLYDGDITGLRRLIDWAHGENHSIVMLHTVATRTKDDGSVASIQVIETNPELMYMSDNMNVPHKVPEYAYKKLKDYEVEQEAGGYNVTTRFYTYKLMRFKLEECRNYKGETSSEKKEVDSWI